LPTPFERLASPGDSEPLEGRRERLADVDRPAGALLGDVKPGDVRISPGRWPSRNDVLSDEPATFEGYRPDFDLTNPVKGARRLHQADRHRPACARRLPIYGRHELLYEL